MTYAQHQAEQLDARQLILDADFETLAVSDSTMLELARQWTAQVGFWLDPSPKHHTS